jgi:hypothetical protein
VLPVCLPFVAKDWKKILTGTRDSQLTVADVTEKCKKQSLKGERGNARNIL